MINHIAGLPVHVLDDTHIFVEPGSAALWKGVGWDIDMVDFPAIYNIDMNHVGLNGRDYPGAFTSGCHYVYALYNPTTYDKGFIASLAIRFNDVVAPPGFTSWRKLMYGQPVVGGRCLPVHATAWPQPSVRFTDSDAVLSVATIGPRGQWVAINLAGYIPENSRLGVFAGRIAGTSGSMWISPVVNVPNPYWKALLEKQVGDSGDVACRVDGAQTVFVWVDDVPYPGAAQLILRGFDMTEVT